MFTPKIKMAASGFGVQMQVRQNAEELGDFMKDLTRWETDIKKKDEELKSSKAVNDKNLPPIRNQKKKKKGKKKDKSVSSNNGQNEPKRISSYDYRSWDKFDVDEELKAIDDAEEMETITSSDEDDDDDDDEYQEMYESERRLQRAIMEKDRGNDLFKEGKYEAAINYYTVACQLDPTSAIMPANRAMALLKLDRYGAAEEDCTLAISMDSTYTKAYLRRASARFHLNKLQGSLEDYQEALKLEPGNKQAQQEIGRLQQIIGVEQDDKTNGKEMKPQQTKSVVPLKRIHIDEIGSDSSDEECNAVTTGGETQNNKPAKITEISSSEETRTTEENQATKEEDLGNDVDKNKIRKEKSLLKDTKTINGLNKQEESEEILEKEDKDGNLEKIDNGCKQQQNKQNDATASDSANIGNIDKNIQQRVDSGGNANKETKKVVKKRVFKVPSTSMQFQADWKILKDNPQEFYEYLTKINPSAFPRLFQRSIESDVLASIIQIYHDFYQCGGLQVLMGLTYLSKVQRFNMAVMFLSEHQKQVLRNIFQFIQEETHCTTESLDPVKKKYGL